MATTKYDKHGKMIRNMNIWLSEGDYDSITRIANAHGLSRAGAISLALIELCCKMDREESRPLLPVDTAEVGT